MGKGMGHRAKDPNALIFVQEKPWSSAKTKKRLKVHVDEEGNRVCKQCGQRTTVQWRRGPDGNASLCNPCGLKFLKVLKREKEFQYAPQKIQLSISQLVD